MLSPTEYETVAQNTLAFLHDTLETADKLGVLELDVDADSLRIEHQNGKVWIVSKHRLTQQIWLASPLQGGLHFEWNATNQQWVLSSNKTLATTLEEDLCPLLSDLFSLAA